MKKVIILIGSYCSGKTEIAINMAIRAAGEGKRTLVVDLDRINDYFRMSDQIPVLTDKRVNIVSPTFVGKGVTQTNMPAAVASAFDQDWDLVVFDVGGDPAGATALGRYHQDFVSLEPGALEVLNVVNIRRPLASTPEKIHHLQDAMQLHSRLTITGMINNTNLSTMTSADDLWDGYLVLREVADRTGIPVAYTTGKKEFLDDFLAKSEAKRS